MIICLKSIRSDLQNMKFIEQNLREIQVKHRCIIEWEYTSAKNDLAVGIFFMEDHSIYYYVSINLVFSKYVHVWSYKSVSLGGGVSLAGGWLYSRCHGGVGHTLNQFIRK